MNKTFIYWTLLGISLCVSSCESHHNPQKTTDKDSLFTIDQIDELKGTDCDIKLGAEGRETFFAIRMTESCLIRPLRFC